MPSTPPPDVYYADPRLAACYDTINGSREDLDHYARIIRELGARTVVDLGCGTGCLAVRLAAEGHEVIGVDPAAASRDIARAKARELPPDVPEITWIHGDATAIGPLGADLAVMTGNVAQVFTTDESWEVTLRSLRGALRPGGHLVFESRRPEARAWEQWRADDTEHRFEVPGIGEVLTRSQVPVIDLPIVSFVDTFHLPGGTELTSTTTLRFRTEAELRATVEAAGFTVLEIRDAPDRPGREHVVIAQAV